VRPSLAAGAYFAKESKIVRRTKQVFLTGKFTLSGIRTEGLRYRCSRPRQRPGRGRQARSDSKFSVTARGGEDWRWTFTMSVGRQGSRFTATPTCSRMQSSRSRELAGLAVGGRPALARASNPVSEQEIGRGLCRRQSTPPSVVFPVANRVESVRQRDDLPNG
jgi:hypothetical protein